MTVVTGRLSARLPVVAVLILCGALSACISVHHSPGTDTVVVPAAPATPGGPAPGHWSWNGTRYVWVAGP